MNEKEMHSCSCKACSHAHESTCECANIHKLNKTTSEGDDNAECAAHSGCSCEHTHEHEHEHKGESSGKACSNKSSACGCGHNHAERDEGLLSIALRTIGAVVLVFAAAYFPQPFNIIAYLAAYLLAGGTVVLNAIKNILRGDFFDENFLMSIATIGAFAIGDFAEAVAVMIFYEIGELLQGLAVSRSRKNIEGLMDIRPEFATLLIDNTEKQVAPEAVRSSDIIIVKPGERVPLDCIVIRGESAVDTSALTGESVPLSAQTGVEIYGGSVNLTGVIICKVTNEYANSTVQKILDLVSEASDKKAKAEKFITRFAKIYTPVVIAAAMAIAFIPLLFGGEFQTWFYRGLIFLVVSCPCALVVSIPVSFMGGIGGAAKRGVLVKGGNVLDTLTSPKAVIFDKTGTLTKGSFAVTELALAHGVTENQLKGAAAICERSSNHPIASSVREAYKAYDSAQEILEYEEISGLGVRAKTAQAEYFAGNAKLMQKNGITDLCTIGAGATVLHILKNGKYLGCVAVADEIKPTAAGAIKALRALGVEKCFMLTGDNEAVAADVAAKVGLDGYKAGLLPHEKVKAFEELTKDIDGACLFAGDGINDAPLLARADIGIAMGGIGSDAAIEAADVVLMTDDLAKLAQAVTMARFTRKIVWQNIIFAMGVKLAVMVVAAFGAVPMWLAIFADVGVALIAVANAARAVLKK